jgi:hypothetical protein
MPSPQDAPPAVPEAVSRQPKAVKAIHEENRRTPERKQGERQESATSSAGQAPYVIMPCPASSAHVARIVTPTGN